MDGGDGVPLESRSSTLDTESSIFAAFNGDTDFFEVALTLSFNGAFGFTLTEVFLEDLFVMGDGDEFLEPNVFSQRGGLLIRTAFAWMGEPFALRWPADDGIRPRGKSLDATRLPPGARSVEVLLL